MLQQKWFKYHPPLEVNVVKPNLVEEKVIAYNYPIVPSAYIEKPHFPVRIKDHSIASTVIRRVLEHISPYVVLILDDNFYGLMVALSYIYMICS